MLCKEKESLQKGERRGAKEKEKERKREKE